MKGSKRGGFYILRGREGKYFQTLLGGGRANFMVEFWNIPYPVHILHDKSLISFSNGITYPYLFHVAIGVAVHLYPHFGLQVEV